MKISEIKDRLNLSVAAGKGNLDGEITGGYVSDLLSDVMANSSKGDIWITLQIHQNAAAVASLKELAGIIIVNDRKPEKETVEKSDTEGIPLLVTGLSAFEIAGRLYELGIRGNDQGL